MSYLRRARIITAGRRLRPRTPEPPPAPFICGVTRSGTTLFRLMLDSHPELAIPGETHFVPALIKRVERHKPHPDELTGLIVGHKRWGDFHLEPHDLRARLRAIDPLTAGDALRAFYMLYAEKHEKSRYGDKTPGYLRDMPRIQRVLPEARFIHIVRDGRDVALSVLKMNWGPATVTEAAELWVERITKARTLEPKTNHYIEQRFEDLLTETEATLRRACEFIDLEFDPVMLDYHERAEERLQEKARDLPRSNRPDQPAELRMKSHELAKERPKAERTALWRTQMSASDREEYERIAAPLLAEFGYPVGEEAAQAAAAAPAGLEAASR
jgi:hypothetical protein